MAFSLKPLSDAVGAEILGLDLSAEIDEAAAEALRQAFRDYHLLLVRGQEIAEEDEVRFAELFGPVSSMGDNMKHGRKIMHISNAHKDGAFPNGPLLFHSDHVFFEHPLKAIALYGVAVPSNGGDTLFSNAAMAWDNLPEQLKQRLASSKAHHVYDYAVNGGNARFSRQSVNTDAPNWIHPVAWPHPETGRTILLVNRLMTDEIVGLDPAESDALLEELFSYIEDRKVIYQHTWQLHDLVIWDNRVLQHARTNFDPAEQRILRRVPIAEDSSQTTAAA